MPKKKTKDLTTVDNKNSDNSKLVISQETAEEVVSGFLREKKGGRQEKYFLYRILGLPPGLSATLCNYNRDYGYKLDKKFREDLNLRARIEQITGSIPEQYKVLCKLRLVEIADIEGKAMVEYKENPKLAIDKPQLLKQVKQAAGVLKEDDQGKPVMINIKKIQMMLRQVGNETVKALPED